MPTQIRMTTPELEHFQVIRELRMLRKEVKPRNDSETAVLNQTLQFFARAGDRRLGSWEVPAENAIYDLAAIGRDVIRLLQSGNCETEVSENTPGWPEDHSASLEDPKDAVSGPNEEQGEAQDTPPWDAVKAAIPSYVKEISFKVDESAMKPGDLEDIRLRFPGVTIRRPKRTPTPPAETAVKTPEVPQIVEKPPAETVVKTPEVPRIVEKPPGFRSAIFIVDRNDLHRSADIAAEVKRTFPWASIRREWAPALEIPKDHMASPEKNKPDEKSVVNNEQDDDNAISSTKPSLLDRMSGDDFRIKGAASPSTRTAVHMSQQSQPNNATAWLCSSGVEPTTTRKDRDSVDDILDDVQMQRKLLFTDRAALKSMYIGWRSRREVLNFSPRNGRLPHYYHLLVDLAIVASHVQDPQLEYSVLWNWQKTNYRWLGDVPPLTAAVRAFQYLSPTAALCGWITIFYSYLWSTKEAQSYEEIRKHCQDSDPDAIASFLFNIAAERCPHTKGGNVPVLEAWCDFHNHTDPNEKAKCEANRDKFIKVSLEDEKQAFEAIQLKNSTEVVVRHGGVVTWSKKRKSTGPLSAGTPSKRGKGA